MRIKYSFLFKLFLLYCIVFFIFLIIQDDIFSDSIKNTVLEDLPSNLRHDKHNNKKVRHYKFPSSRIDRQSQNDKNLSNPEVQYVSENVFRQGESNIQKLNIFGSPPIKVKNFKTATDGFEVDLKKLSSKISQDNQQLREILTSPKKDGSSIKILRKEKPIWFQRLTMDKFSADENKFKDNFLKINETLINQQLDHLKSQFLFYEYNKFDDDLMNTIGSMTQVWSLSLILCFDSFLELCL